MWRKTIFNMADGILTPCNVAWSSHWFCQVTVPCNVALESWQWIHQVAAPCNVIHGSGMTCCLISRWQHPAMWHLALGSWHLIRQVAAPSNVAGGYGMTCHWIRPNVPHFGILRLVSISTISLQSTCHCTSLRNFIQIGPPCRKQWRHVDFQDGGSRPSWILGVQ